MEQESKRVKVTIPDEDIKITVSVLHGNDPVVGDFNQFVNEKDLRDHARRLIDQKIHKQETKEDERDQRILALAQLAIPSASIICWEEDGAIEDVSIGHYFYGSKHDIDKEFDTCYLLNFDIRMNSSADPDDDSQGLWLSFFARLNHDAGDDKVHFDYAVYTFEAGIIWDDKGPFPADLEKLEPILLEIIDTEVDEPMCGILKNEITAFNFRKLAEEKTNT